MDAKVKPLSKYNNSCFTYDTDYYHQNYKIVPWNQTQKANNFTFLIVTVMYEEKKL